MKKIFLLFTILFLLFQTNSKAQVYGCTDLMANNYNKNATKNDGSCTYNAAQVAPLFSYNLDAVLAETSGLTKWNNQIWTHNDDTDLKLYALDTSNGNIIKTYLLNGLSNTDWEDISQDEKYLYIGDFGNNSSGNRKDLKIFRIEKNSILANSPFIDTIRFYYEDQTDFSAKGSNNTDFDCEAFIVAGDSIFLFTKQWINHQTRLYAFPKSPGNHIAFPRTILDVQGLITGAVILPEKNLVALCAYSSSLQPFFYLLYNYNGTNYFSGNKRKIDISLPFYQVEGIATTNGLKYFLSNEYFTKPPIITTDQKLHIFDLNAYLSNYLIGGSSSISENNTKNKFEIFPNPATNLMTVTIDENMIGIHYSITDLLGKKLLTGKLLEQNSTINIEVLPIGNYLFSIGNYSKHTFKVLKN